LLVNGVLRKPPVLKSSTKMSGEPSLWQGTLQALFCGIYVFQPVWVPAKIAGKVRIECFENTQTDESQGGADG